WSPATLNYPVTSGDSFWADPGARAEVRFGPTAIHLDGGTELKIGTLDDSAFAATVAQGRINIRIGELQPDESYALTLPRGAVTLTGAGTYSIEAGDEDVPTRVTVLAGRAQFLDRGTTTMVDAGQAIEINGTAEAPTYAVMRAAATEFDDWALARDRRDE